MLIRKPIIGLMKYNSSLYYYRKHWTYSGTVLIFFLELFRRLTHKSIINKYGEDWEMRDISFGWSLRNYTYKSRKRVERVLTFGVTTGNMRARLTFILLYFRKVNNY
jgi:hypothetical protein